MKILIYSYNDKIGDGLQKITFIQRLKSIYPESHITYTTTKSWSDQRDDTSRNISTCHAGDNRDRGR